MGNAYPNAGALDYENCTYGASRLLFRGPKRLLDRTFIAVLGGSECYGRCAKFPFPDLLQRELGLPVANFGLPNAGPDVFLNDPHILAKAGQAAVCIVQLFGVQNTSNRYYTVHPRRNDRFLSAKPSLRALFPQIDFTEFNFTRHLLHALQIAAPDAFDTFVRGLQDDWATHMRSLLAQIGGKPLLLWVDEAMPPTRNETSRLCSSTMLINAEMIAALAPYSGSVIYALTSQESRAEGLEGMIFNQAEQTFAASLPSPYAHREICAAVLPFIENRLGCAGKEQRSA